MIARTAGEKSSCIIMVNINLLLFQVNPVLVPDKKLVYSLYLASALTTGNLPGGANVTTGASRTAVIEYSGVVVIAPDTQQLVAVEDGKVRVF